MKFNSILFAVLVLLGGCGEPNLDDAKTLDKILAEAIDDDKIQERGQTWSEIFLYAPNEQEPYTGWIKKMYDNGQVQILFHTKNGKKDGLTTQWYESGQKELERTFKDGKLISSEFWKTNGEKIEPKVKKTPYHSC